MQDVSGGYGNAFGGNNLPYNRPSASLGNGNRYVRYNIGLREGNAVCFIVNGSTTGL